MKSAPKATELVSAAVTLAWQRHIATKNIAYRRRFGLPDEIPAEQTSLPPKEFVAGFLSAMAIYSGHTQTH